MRRAAKRDKNEREIISTWEAMGAYVESVSGPGLVDTLVHRKEIFRAEVKGAKRGLTKKQVENFTKAWRAGVPTYIIRTEADARSLLLGSVERSRLEWRPEHGALAGASRKERPFRPGKDKARTLSEMCKGDFCTTSAVPGTVPPRCAAHAAEETFAPGPIETLTLLPKGGALLSPPRSGAKAGDPRYVEFVPAIHGVDVGPPSRVVLSLGDKTMDVTGYSDEEMAEAAARLINKEAKP